MKFKVGQKVRIKQWFDMPQEMENMWGINTRNIGIIGVIQNVGADKGIENIYDINTYSVVFSNKPLDSLFVFEPELEPLVRIGQQLLLFEL